MLAFFGWAGSSSARLGQRQIQRWLYSVQPLTQTVSSTPLASGCVTIFIVWSPGRNRWKGKGKSENLSGTINLGQRF